MNKDAIPHHMRVNEAHAGIREVEERCPGLYYVDVRPPGSEDWGRVAYVIWNPNYDYRLINKVTGETVVLSLASDQKEVTLEPESNADELLTETDPDGIDAHVPGSKLDAGKPRAHLVLGDFSRALAAVVDVGTHGARKYTDHGWCWVRDGEDRYADAAMRHYLERCHGRDIDANSGLLHLAHQAWNVLAELELTLRNAETSSDEDRNAEA